MSNLKDYYAVLGVTRNATLHEIEQSYIRQRSRLGSPGVPALSEIEQAFQVLRQPSLKRRYDAALAKGRMLSVPEQEPQQVPGDARRPEPARSDQESADTGVFSDSARLVLLAASGVALLLVLYLGVWPHVSWHFKVYAPGTELERVDGMELGVVLEYDSSHDFAQGRSASAYRIRLPDGKESWIPRKEVNLMSKPRAGRGE